MSIKISKLTSFTEGRFAKSDEEALATTIKNWLLRQEVRANIKVE